MRTLSQLFHRHVWTSHKNWAILDGDLVTLEQQSCSCGLYKSPELTIVATKEELAEANTKIITTNRT